MTVTVLGSANLDLVYRVERIPAPGETVLATGFAEHPGGKGNNQVIAVARAGASVTFVAAMGSDAAATTLTDQLAADGVRPLVRTVDAPTGTALITVDDGAENSIVVNSGANALLVDLDEGEERAVCEADVLLMQLETPLATVTHAARIAREAGTLVVLNAAPVFDLPRDLLDTLDVLIVNEHEAAELARFAGAHAGADDDADADDDDAADPGAGATDTDADGADAGLGANGDADPNEGFARLATALTRLVPVVVVTIGASGVLVARRDGGEPLHVAGRRVDATDTTGAGDTFCGAFVAALDEGASDGNGDATRAGRAHLDLDLERAARFATVAAALSVQRAGAVPSIPTRQDIDDAL